MNTASKNASFEPAIVRPGGVLPKSPSVFQQASGMLFPNVRVDELAATMIDLALNSKSGELLENAELKSRGAQLLKPGNEK